MVHNHITCPPVSKQRACWRREERGERKHAHLLVPARESPSACTHTHTSVPRFLAFNSSPWQQEKPWLRRLAPETWRRREEWGGGGGQGGGREEEEEEEGALDVNKRLHLFFFKLLLLFTTAAPFSRNAPRGLLDTPPPLPPSLDELYIRAKRWKSFVHVPRTQGTRYLFVLGKWGNTLLLKLQSAEDQKMQYLHLHLESVSMTLTSCNCSNS